MSLCRIIARVGWSLPARSKVITLKGWSSYRQSDLHAKEKGNKKISQIKKW